MSRFQCSRLLPAPPPWRRLNRRSPSHQALPIRSPKASRVFRQTGARRIARAGRHPLPRRQRALLRPRPARAARTRVFPPSGNEALRAPQKVEWVGFARQRPHLPQCAAARENRFAARVGHGCEPRRQAEQRELEIPTRSVAARSSRAWAFRFAAIGPAHVSANLDRILADLVTAAPLSLGAKFHRYHL
jgi:hypothetical protein